MNLLFVKLDYQLRKVEYFFALIAGMIALLVMLMVTLDVLFRNLFNTPIVAVYELVTYSFIGMIALGFPYVQAQNQNVVIEVATSSLPAKYKNVLDLIGTVIGLFVIGIIAWQTGISTISSFVGNEYSSGLIRIPIWPAKLVLSIGLTFLAIRLFLDFFLIATNSKNRKDESETTTIQ
ncbi:TRAP transporter small permease subunit [Alkalihalobacillus deserti]|uniref:TRAP transporter small permease subunit n=1 Tax=Alkalihalobacillus deserti TaxID=2879466 RepID=UPI001D13FECE|nr:TRAP transporter small permease [Alkalihalobacillus deserti]